jgi:hypothetical protein
LKNCRLGEGGVPTRMMCSLLWKWKVVLAGHPAESNDGFAEEESSEG